MSDHEHDTKDESATQQSRDEVAKKAYAIYVKEGRPEGHADQNRSDAEAQLKDAGASQADPPEHQDEHHARMAADFLRRFWISLLLTLPIRAPSPLLQSLVGLRDGIRFIGDSYILLRPSAGRRRTVRLGRAAHARPGCRADGGKHGDRGSERAASATEEVTAPVAAQQLPAAACHSPPAAGRLCSGPSGSSEPGAVRDQPAGDTCGTASCTRLRPAPLAR